MSESGNVRLVRAASEELHDVARALQEAFAPAVREAFGPRNYGPIPPDEDVWASFRAPGAQVYHIVRNEERVGGAVVRIDEESGCNALELFFISPAFHGRGLGLAAWRAIEAKYPQTKVWETVTPYFEKRNIHFYVNRCGFHIVEFFNAHHRDPDVEAPLCPDGLPLPGMDEYFRFQKIMGGVEASDPAFGAASADDGQKI